MQALIDKHAAAFALPGGPPAPAGIISLGAKPFRNDPGKADDLPEVAVGDEFFDLSIARFGPHLEHGGKHLPGMPTARGNQPLRISLVGGDRFFDHDVQPGLQRGDAQGGVLVMRRGNDDGINLARADQFQTVVKNLQPALLVGTEFAQRRGGNRLQFASVNFSSQEIFRVMTPDVSHANDAESN